MKWNHTRRCMCRIPLLVLVFIAIGCNGQGDFGNSWTIDAELDGMRAVSQRSDGRFSVVGAYIFEAEREPDYMQQLEEVSNLVPGLDEWLLVQKINPQNAFFDVVLLTGSAEKATIWIGNPDSYEPGVKPVQYSLDDSSQSKVDVMKKLLSGNSSYSMPLDADDGTLFFFTFHSIGTVSRSAVYYPDKNASCDIGEGPIKQGKDADYQRLSKSLRCIHDIVRSVGISKPFVN